MKRRQWCVMSLLFALLCVAFVGSLVFGTTPIGYWRMVDIMVGGVALDNDAVVVWSVRLPRALTALLAGAGLAVAGLQMQTLFRNPLADPFVLGVTAGATLGVALLVLGTGIGVGMVWKDTIGVAGDGAIVGAAFAGASAVLLLVLTVASRVADPTTVLILGLMLGYASAALVTVMVGVSEPQRLQQWASWGFGSFSGVGWARLGLLAPAIGLGLAIAAATASSLNVLLLGERYAVTMGLSVRRLRVFTIAGVSLLGAVVTAFCGPVSFIGVAAPHLCRACLGTSDHRVLLPAVICAGGILALVAQALTLLPGRGVVLPLNAVTALLGTPVVAMVMLRRRRRAWGE